MTMMGTKQTSLNVKYYPISDNFETFLKIQSNSI